MLGRDGLLQTKGIVDLVDIDVGIAVNELHDLQPKGVSDGSEQFGGNVQFFRVNTDLDSLHECALSVPSAFTCGKYRILIFFTQYGSTKNAVNPLIHSIFRRQYLYTYGII